VDDKTKMILKVALIGVAAYFGYRYLQSSGLWAQWFGGVAANSFSDANQLLAYCKANPNGTAVYTGSGQSVTATCQQWIASMGSAPLTSPVSPTPTPSASVAPLNIPVPTSVQLLQVVNQQPGTLYSSDQWCWAYNKATGTPCPSNAVAGSSMSADQFVAALQAYNRSGGQVGVAGLDWQGPVLYSRVHYKWLSTRVQ